MQEMHRTGTPSTSTSTVLAGRRRTGTLSTAFTIMVVFDKSWGGHRRYTETRSQTVTTAAFSTTKRGRGRSRLHGREHGAKATALGFQDFLDVAHFFAVPWPSGPPVSYRWIVIHSFCAGHSGFKPKLPPNGTNDTMSTMALGGQCTRHKAGSHPGGQSRMTAFP